MQKVSLQQAVQMTGKSESTLRRDVKKGKTSADRDERGYMIFDVSELQRVYGELKNTGDDAPSVEQSNDNAMTEPDSAEVLAIKDNQIVDLKVQLEKAEMRETTLIDEKSKLLDLLAAEKEEKRALMPLPEEKAKSRNWLLRLVGAR